ncbi:MAG: 23S rRNA (pseudouridine(1915)-N(3))-methyltransferase RlmH [Gammaproteobacteria bacterium]|nr:23S rRNA (pseudouridine(1915)-N(3))-methyltransferase RlmH [Gammaproteobacteria bacterium]
MRIQLLAIGTRMPAWVDAGYTEYAERLPADCRMELVEIPLGVRSKGGDVARAVASEGTKMLRAVGKGNVIIALDVKGISWSTEELAGRLKQWMQEGRNLSLLVGGPDGLAADCLQAAHQKWSLSPLTLPHGLVRVLIAEQFYRAWSILRGHPYHRS